MRALRVTTGVAAAFGVAALSAAVVLTRLGTPDDIYFDEVYYVEDARGLLATGAEAGFVVHPPLGKWVIAAGIRLLGDGPVGWRLGIALLSVLAVGLTVALGRRLTGHVWAGVLAGLLLALDGLWLVQARIAMLDTTMVVFVVLGAYLFVVDHQRVTGPVLDGQQTRPSRRRGGRWPLYAAGAAFGAAAATKWSGLLALGAAGLLAGGWQLAAWRRHRLAARREAFGIEEVGDLNRADDLDCPDDLADPGRVTALARGLGRIAVALVAVPALVYLASYGPWLAGYEHTRAFDVACDADDPADCDRDLAARLRGLVIHHRDVARFHLGLEAEHSYRAPATTWAAQTRPVVYFYESCDADGNRGDEEPCQVASSDQAAEIVALGNPALWWPALLLTGVAAAALRRRDGAAIVPLTFLAAQLVPWLAASRPVFGFYAVALVPFVALNVAVACVELGRPGRRAATAIGILGGGAAAAAATMVAGASIAVVTSSVLLTATIGGAVGGLIDDLRGQLHGEPPGRPRLDLAVAGAVLTAAVILFAYFLILWVAWPVAEETLRARWWFPTWI